MHQFLRAIMSYALGLRMTEAARARALFADGKAAAEGRILRPNRVRFSLDKTFDIG